VSGLNRLNLAFECARLPIASQAGNGDDAFSKKSLSASIFVVGFRIELAHRAVPFVPPHHILK
jgi:hypothetical protein